MDWTHTITVIGSLGAFTFWLFSKLDSDIKAQNQRLDMFSQRLDQLYQMHIDLLKDRRNNQ